MASPKKNQSAQALPDNVIGLLSAADTRNGLPPGTMYSIMQQEIGGQYDRFLADPTAYHYAADKDGRRVAPHTGKVSTAFGPFGILESTAKDPGYGVAPLKDKSLEEQVRFASDYLAGRSKKDGLKAGLAGYGEGGKYADQVAGRISGEATAAAPIQVAQADKTQLQAAATVLPQLSIQEQAAVQAVPAGPDPWQLFLELSRQTQPLQVADLEYGRPRQLPGGGGVVIPDFSAAIEGAGQGPDFGEPGVMSGFSGMSGIPGLRGFA